MYAVILAGGIGTRLWPRSRAKMPKQLLDIIAEKTMLQETIHRLLPKVSFEDVYIVTTELQAATVSEQLPRIPKKNIIIEPVGRSTAPCIGLAALYLKRIDPQMVMASFHADHLIRKEKEFIKTVAVAEEMARAGYLVTIGIPPDYPDTGYGYIKRGNELKNVDGYKIFKLDSFTEKPSLQKAKEYLEKQEAHHAKNPHPLGLGSINF